MLAETYPGIRLVTHEEAVAENLVETVYATYSIGLFFDDTACDMQPTDFRHVGLHRTAAYILGVDPAEQAPRLAFSADGPPIAEPYAVIAVQSSSGCKYWTNPTGWLEVVRHLKASGLRVICIDQRPAHGQGLMWTQIPNGAEDETGDRPAAGARPLAEARHRLPVGLSSGLAWLAWAAGCPVVLISGFTHPTNEFTTPYRVINWHACNSCWNDPRLRFDHHDFLWCPRHKDTGRHFECTRLITADQVIQVLARVPGLSPDRNLAHHPLQARDIAMTNQAFNVSSGQTFGSQTGVTSLTDGDGVYVYAGGQAFNVTLNAKARHAAEWRDRRRARPASRPARR